MLDKLCKKLLKILNELCGENNYSIIEITEIIEKMSGKIDLDVLNKYISYLSENSYIDVKYLDSKQVCLALMPKAKGMEEENKIRRKNSNKYIRMSVMMSLISAISGFLGAFLGSFLFNLLR